MTGTLLNLILDNDGFVPLRLKNIIDLAITDEQYLVGNIRAFNWRKAKKVVYLRFSSR
ncbi:hypothetical protein AB0758_30880 [Tolypothrix bouteillei VB521301_2]|uniref:hypothetical protein n=1 Tax=Tolypothrix bouteillei TaxID=1246981 RepID=UPI0038B58D3C